jgi:hypothetical protein
MNERICETLMTGQTNLLWGKFKGDLKKCENWRKEKMLYGGHSMNGIHWADK